jgi:hypothetical protein
VEFKKEFNSWDDCGKTAPGFLPPALFLCLTRLSSHLSVHPLLITKKSSFICTDISQLRPNVNVFLNTIFSPRFLPFSLFQRIIIWMVLSKFYYFSGTEVINLLNCIHSFPLVFFLRGRSAHFFSFSILSFSRFSQKITKATCKCLSTTFSTLITIPTLSLRE